MVQSRGLILGGGHCHSHDHYWTTLHDHHDHHLILPTVIVKGYPSETVLQIQLLPHLILLFRPFVVQCWSIMMNMTVVLFLMICM